MGHEVHGQHVGRQQRTEEYSRWSGATPVDEDGQIKEAATGADPAVVEAEVTQIRNLISSGVANIRVDISHEPTVEAIKEALSEDERKVSRRRKRVESRVNVG